MALTAFLVNYLQLSALLHALEHFPENTPKRWDAIATYIALMQPSACSSDNTGMDKVIECCIEEVAIDSKSNTSHKRSKRVFSATTTDCKELTNILQSSYLHIFRAMRDQYQPLYSTPDRSSPLKPIVLTPPIDTCSSHIKLSYRASSPIVYTINGTFIAASYHGTCTKCNKVYFPSYYEQGSTHTSRH